MTKQLKIKTIKHNAKLNPRQLRFCHFYVNNPETYSNATFSYASAYEYDLWNASKTLEIDQDGKQIPLSSDYERMRAVCSANGSRLLLNDIVQKEIGRLLLESLNDNDVDKELSKLIKQEYNPQGKLGGIKEYNKLRQRIVDKIDHTTDGKPITIQISETVAKKNGLK